VTGRFEQSFLPLATALWKRTYRFSKNDQLAFNVACEEVADAPLDDRELLAMTGLLAAKWADCGHYKRQVVGTGRHGRQIIWIEPYWRGPENAPILARPWRIGTEAP
jgi:hypothetical protein